MSDRARLRTVSIWERDSPNTRYFAWISANRSRSRVPKNRRWYRARARWKALAPRMIVLSTSKKAAARAGGDDSAGDGMRSTVSAPLVLAGEHAAGIRR